MKKWEAFYMPTSELRDALMVYLKTMGIYGEPSACGNGFHFEILCTKSECETIIEMFCER